MEIKENRSGDVVVVEVFGRLSIGEGDSAIRDRLAMLLMAGEKKILVGMSGVTALDSSGIGELVAARQAAVENDAQIKLAQLSPKVGQVLKVTQLIGVFEIYDTLDEGLASFA